MWVQNRTITFTDSLINFLLEILGFLSPKLGTNYHFTMAKDNICWCIGPCSCLNQFKSPFSFYFKSFKTLLQKDVVLSNFLSILCLKACVCYFWKKNVFLRYFKRSSLKRNLTYSCFFFPSFHEHSLSLELPRAARLLKISCFEK